MATPVSTAPRPPAGSSLQRLKEYAAKTSASADAAKQQVRAAKVALKKARRSSKAAKKAAKQAKKRLAAAQTIVNLAEAVKASRTKAAAMSQSAPRGKTATRSDKGRRGRQEKSPASAAQVAKSVIRRLSRAATEPAQSSVHDSAGEPGGSLESSGAAAEPHAAAASP